MPNTGSCCPGPWLPTPAVSGPALNRTLTQQAVSILAMYGADAHLYLPGVGMVTGVTAGNYFTSTFSPLAGIDTTVGGVLDAQGDLGAELLPNGFTGGTVLGGTTIVDGIVNINLQSTGLAAYVDNTPGFAAGKVYRVSVTATDLTQTTDVRFQGVAIATAIASEGAVVYTRTFVAPTLTTSRIDVSVGSGARGTITVSIREVQGIHATQATAANRPMLRRGAVNLLTYSQDFTNAAWVTSGGATKSGQTVTLGNTYASYFAQISSLIPIGAACTTAFILSGTPGAQVYVGVQDNGGAFAGSSELVTLTAIPTLYVATRPATAFASVRARVSDAGAATTVTIGGAALFVGTYTAAQIQALGGIPLTTTAPASTAFGSYFWEFDGVNDSLSLSAPLFQMSDDHCVIAGASVANTSAPSKTLVCASFSNAGSKRVAQLRVDAGGVLSSLWYDGFTIALPASSFAAITAAIPFVASARRVFTLGVLRLNGAQVAAASLASQTGFTPDVGQIGSAVSAELTTGSIYPVIAIKGTVSDADLLTLERFIGSLSGVTI